MSAGTRLAIFGSAPPKITFSPEPSRWLSTILNGPGPLKQAMACASWPTAWQSETYESMTAVLAAVDADAALQVAGRRAVDVEAIEDDVVRHVGELGRGGVAELAPARRSSRSRRRASISRPTRRKWCAPLAATNALSVLGARIFGMCAASAGVTRVPAAGSCESAERTTIQPSPDLLGRVNGPVNVAPASIVI